LRDELIGCSVRGARSPIGRYLRAATRTPQTVIIVCDNTHDGISLHALLQKEAVEEIGGSAWIGRHKDETRAELSIALYATRRYLELARKANPRAIMTDDVLRRCLSGNCSRKGCGA
jgi:hypothetical protein